METMMRTPAPVGATTSVRRAMPSYVPVPETFAAALPTMAAATGHACTWSFPTDGTVIRPAAMAHKANGTRGPEENST